MLFKYKEISYFSELFAFGKEGGGDATPLPAMLLSCGHSQAAQYPGYLCDGQHPAIIPSVIWQYTLAGEGVLDFEETRGIKLVPGTLMLLTAPHKFRYYPAKPEGEWEFLFICMNGDLALRLCRELMTLHGPVNQLPVDSLALDSARGLMSQARDQKISCRWTASLLAYDLIMKTAMELSACASVRSYPPFIQRAFEYCESHADRPLPVEVLAKAAGLSQYHFVRQFKANVGIPPSEYIRELRLCRARHLLQMSSVSVKEIAEACGFVSANHFSRIFRSRFGMAPGKIRKAR